MRSVTRMVIAMRSAINLDEGRARRIRRAYQPVERTPAEKEDRERRKRVWLDRIDADLPTDEVRREAGEFHVSLRLVRQVTGLIVNLDSFLDRGHVYASQAGLADHIKNANEKRISDRQVRRVVCFLEARGHLRVERTRGTRNQMWPLYRALDVKGAVASDTISDCCGSTTTPGSGARAPDTISSDQGRHVLPFDPPCPPNQESKLLDEPLSKSPPLPPTPAEPIEDGGSERELARTQVAASSDGRPPQKNRVDEHHPPLSTAEFETLKAEYVKWELAAFDPLAPEPRWYPSAADPERGKIGPPDFFIWERRLCRRPDEIPEQLDVEFARVPRVPFNELWALIQKGNRGPAIGAYLKLTPKQTHDAKRGLLEQLQAGPLPDDFPVAATYFGMVGLGQVVGLAPVRPPMAGSPMAGSQYASRNERRWAEAFANVDRSIEQARAHAAAAGSEAENIRDGFVGAIAQQPNRQFMSPKERAFEAADAEARRRLGIFGDDGGRGDGYCSSPTPGHRRVRFSAKFQKLFSVWGGGGWIKRRMETSTCCEGSQTHRQRTCHVI
jgi:hypothetical protein